MPHAPQFELSVCVLTHVVTPPLPQTTSSFDGHVAEHLPLTHACPDGHTLPQDPQLSLSFLRSAQKVLHAVWVDVQFGVVEDEAFAQLAAITSTPSPARIAPRRVIPAWSIA